MIIHNNNINILCCRLPIGNLVFTMAEAMKVTQHLSMKTSWNTGKDEVISLCYARENNVLTGHESLMISWSVDVQNRFSPAAQTATIPVDGCVTCIRQFPLSERLALSANQTVFVYDCTISNGNIVSLMLTDRFCFNTDEINEIDIHSKETFICACDDNGEIKIIDLDNKKLLRTLSKFHDNICSTVKFSLRKPWELLTGGLDTKLGRWDFSRGRLLARVTTRGDASKAELMINPPMVHCMALIRSQNCVVCGLGDGRLLIYSLKLSKGVDLVCESRMHASSIACVCCVERTPTSCDKLISYVVSVGNDSTICVHTLDSCKDLTSIGLQCVDRLEGITKVNSIDAQNDNDNFFVFTADVSGTVSVYNCMLS